MVTPKIHNHNHKYNTRSKRNCYLCSSTQGCISAKEPDIQNQDHLTCQKESTYITFPKRRGGGRQGVRNKIHVACAHSSAFPDDLLFNILLFIPAKILHENMRFVSRVWRQTITSPSFITNHLQISSACTHGLLVDHPEQPTLALYIKPPTSDANPEFQVTELAKSPFHSWIRGSYNGLLLVQHAPNIHQFHVVNPVTKSIVSLPYFSLLASLSPENGPLSLVGVAFSYASSINRYKVVIGIHVQGKNLFQYFPPQVWVFTVGVDQNWRKLELRGIDEIRGTFRRVTYHTPRSVGGIVYWSCHSYPYGCALDVDTERFYRFTTFARPITIPDILNPKYWIICLQTGLGLVICYKLEFRSRYELWELYELTDLKSSKWTKIIDIDVRVIHRQIKKYFQTSKFLPWLRPIVYTNDEKLWFVSSGSSTCMFYYNTREENVMRVPMNRKDGKNISAYHHVNTLLELKNC